VTRRQGQGQAWRYDPKSSAFGQGGSGNNWAMGYCHHGPGLRDDLLAGPIRREMEACDRFEGFLLLQSMAGGTGAGLGAFVAEALAEEFPSATLLSHAVWPYKQGEVTVQSYNTMLTVSKLTAACDGVVVARNDTLSDICTKLLRISSPGFDDLNEVAAQTLAHALLPSHAETEASLAANRAAAGAGAGGRGGAGPPGPSGAGAGAGAAAPEGGRRAMRALSAAAEHLCAHPGYRLLSAASVPQMPPAQVDFEVFRWEPTLWRLRSMLSHGALVEAGHHRGRDPPPGDMHKCIASLFTLRGRGAPRALADPAVFGARGLYHRAAPSPVLVATDPGPFRCYDLSASFVANSTAVLGALDPLLEDVGRMASAGAYLHQYARFGLEGDDVLESLARVEDVAGRYRALRAS